MSQKYFTTLTHIGAALHANAQLQQTTVAWTHLVLGDGNGAEPVPNPAQTGVIREVDRLPISSIEPDPDNPSWIVIEAVIPADRGGYVVRETALMGGANGASCIAVGNYPSATKPLLSDGAGSELVIRIVVEIAHTATVTLKIDPAVVIASRGWVEKLVTNISADSGMVVISSIGVTHWEVPDVLRSGKKKARVRGVGGGGSGGKSVNPQTVTLPSLSLGSGGGGGGGGGFEILVNLLGMSSVACSIGAGGAPVAASGSVGVSGGTTSFGAIASALGGQGGSAVGGRVLGGGGVLGEGVTGVLFPGGGSGSYVSNTSGNQNVGYTCSGGGSLFSQVAEFGGPVTDAISYGGGGAGAFSTHSVSGAGAPGIIVIEW